MFKKNKEAFTVLSEEELKAYRERETNKRTFNPSRATVGAAIGATAGLALAVGMHFVKKEHANRSEK